MAMALNAGEIGRADLFFIDPDKIVLGKNGRWDDHDEESIKVLADSYEMDGGQLEPVEVRRVEDKKVMLTMGFRRHAAALEYNRRHPDNPMKLKCVVVMTDDKDAFLRNITENRERKATSVVDDAFNQKRMREEFGMADAQIAARYRMDQSQVSKLKKLPVLREHILKLVHKGFISFDNAVDLADLSTAEQDEVIAKLGDLDTLFKSVAPVGLTLPGMNGVANQQTVVARPVGPAEAGPTPPVEQHVVTPKNRKGTNTGKKKAAKGAARATKRKANKTVTAAIRKKKAAKGKKKGRSIGEVKEFLEGLTGPAEFPPVRSLAEIFLKFIDGRLDETAMQEGLELFVGDEEKAAVGV
jgi:ParB/RepB/Spo0J family partition protein